MEPRAASVFSTSRSSVPSEETARICLEAGCLWNTFVLVGKAAAFLRMGGEAVPEVSDRLAHLIHFLGTEDEAWAMHLDPDGKIVLAGRAYDPPTGGARPRRTMWWSSRREAERSGVMGWQADGALEAPGRTSSCLAPRAPYSNTPALPHPSPPSESDRLVKRSALRTTRTVHVRVVRIHVAAAATAENAARFHTIGAEQVGWLEQQIDITGAVTSIPKEFILPGDTPSGAFLDLARAVVRRAERCIAEEIQRGDVANHALLQYLNRLSDFLFVNLNLQGPQSVDSRGRVLYGQVDSLGRGRPAVVSSVRRPPEGWVQRDGACPRIPDSPILGGGTLVEVWTFYGPHSR